MKLKKKPARPARKGVNPFTKEPCVFKAKPASKTVRALPMKKFKELVNWDGQVVLQ
jgi:DNA-binding protein HU-beta